MFINILLLLSVGLVSAQSNRAPCYAVGTYGIICVHGNMTNVSQAYPGFEVTRLTVSQQNITIIGEFDLEVFRSVQVLEMLYCKTELLTAGSLEPLQMLEELDLSHNSISDLPYNIFSRNENLRTVSFQDNPLRTIPNLPKNVEYADFSHCKISYLPHLNNTKHLNYLDIDYNRLHSLSSGVFSSIAHVDTLNLRKNPWLCGVQFNIFVCEYFHNYLFTNRPTSLYCQKGHKKKNFTKSYLETSTCKNHFYKFYNDTITTILGNTNLKSSPESAAASKSQSLETLTHRDISQQVQTTLQRSESQYSNELNNKLREPEQEYNRVTEVMKNVSRTTSLSYNEEKEAHVTKYRESGHSTNSTEKEESNEGTKSNRNETDRPTSFIIILACVIMPLVVLTAFGLRYLIKKNISGRSEKTSNMNFTEYAGLAQGQQQVDSDVE